MTHPLHPPLVHCRRIAKYREEVAQALPQRRVHLRVRPDVKLNQESKDLIVVDLAGEHELGGSLDGSGEGKIVRLV